MTVPRLGVWSACVLAALAADVRAAPPEEARDVAALAAKIDASLEANWKKAGVEPAPLADDAEFLRRACLDLAGRVPSVSRVRAFLDDARPTKRRLLIEELLAGPHFVNHFTNVWRALLVPEASANQQARSLAPSMEAWVRKQLQKNAAYDEMVREIITAPIGPDAMRGGDNASPMAFYLAKELKPENVAGGAARLFLGIKIECAQCHNHPFADWKRDQFWAFAAFFGGLQRQQQGDFVQPGKEIVDRRDLKIPGTEKVVQAMFPDGAAPDWKAQATTRATLAAWMTRADNPYFAKAAANRLWAHFFGTGLVEPVDEIAGGPNKPSHPELLDELARQLAAHRFDLKFLMRAITASKAYQRASASTHASQDDLQQFARMAVKGLTPEQLFDSLTEATGFRDGNNRGGSVRQESLTKFGTQVEKPTDVQTSILQALTLMNGRLVADATSLERSETLTAVLDAPFLDTAGRIEVLYLATLSRKPRPREASRAEQYLDAALAPAEGAAPPTDEQRDALYKQALADVLWALLNSGEFFLNH